MKKKLIAILALIVLAVGCLSLVACEEEEEPIPWWEDKNNLEYVLEDERSVEKKVIYERGVPNLIVFNYTFIDWNSEEFIPKLKIYWKGEEQNICIYIQTKEIYSENLDRYNAVSVVKGIGKYNIYSYVYANEDDMNNTVNKIFSIGFQVIVTKGE